MGYSSLCTWGFSPRESFGIFGIFHPPFGAHRVRSPHTPHTTHGAIQNQHPRNPAHSPRDHGGQGRGVRPRHRCGDLHTPPRHCLPAHHPTTISQFPRQQQLTKTGSMLPLERRFVPISPQKGIQNTLLLPRRFKYRKLPLRTQRPRNRRQREKI